MDKRKNSAVHTSTKNNLSQACRIGNGRLLRLLSALLFLAGCGISALATPRITTHFDYDANHNVTNRVAGDGIVTGYRYDDVNRLIHIDNPGNEHDVSFTYNAGSLVTQVVDNTGITEFTYHPDFDWLLEARRPNGHFINYQYDPQGRLIHASGDNLPGVSVAYDVEDRVVRTTDALGASTRIYNPTTGQLVERRLSNGIRIHFSYDPETGEVTGISQYKPDGSLIADITYQYYPDGMLELETEATLLGVRSIGYQYDDLWRLTNVTHSTGRVEEYEYDANGNRLRKRVSENGKVTEDTLYRYNRINQIAQAGDEVIFHDGRGNIVRRVQPDADTGEMRETRYGWSPDNRLISVEELVDGVMGKTVTYQYDGFRKRVAKKTTENGEITTTEYINNDALLYSPVLEYKDGLLKREYLADGYIEGGQARYELVALGGGLRMFDDNGIEIASVQYDSFGNIMAATGDASRIDHWKGEFLDPDTGLVYLRNRWYDPITGRWLSNDPIGISGGLNQYAAFNNNPVMFRDPSGLCTEKFDTINKWIEGTKTFEQYIIDQMASGQSDYFAFWSGWRAIGGGVAGYGGVGAINRESRPEYINQAIDKAETWYYVPGRFGLILMGSYGEIGHGVMNLFGDDQGYTTGQDWMTGYLLGEWGTAVMFRNQLEQMKEGLSSK